MIKRQTTLSANLVAFCRHLRDYGFTIGISEERDSLIALDIIQPFETPEWFQLSLQTTLCKTQKQLEIFPQLYRNYWHELDRAVDSKVDEKASVDKNTIADKTKQPIPSIQAIKKWLHGNNNEETTETASYSDMHVIGKSKFAGFDEQELKEIFKLVKKLVNKIANRRSRRYSRSHKKAQIDLKQMMRKNVLRNGELIELLYKEKKQEEIKVVLLCDVSKSMELYSKFLIQFMYAFQNLFPRIETFVFSTSLSQVTTEMNGRSIDQSLKQVMDKVNNWSGGTRIGTSIQTFNKEFAFKQVNSKTLVMVLSDGWDTGESDLLAEEMKKLQRKAMQLIWLNPLAGSRDWEPEVVGMKAALPYVDLMLPFHDIESLRSVVVSI